MSAKLALQANPWYNEDLIRFCRSVAINNLRRDERKGHFFRMATIPQKRCTNPDCQKLLPATSEYFHRDKQKRDGLTSRCKACQSAENDPLQRQNYNKSYYRNNRDRFLAEAKRYRQENRELVRITNRNQKSRRKSILGKHTLQQIQDLLKRQKYRCYYCSSKFQQVNERYVFHIDHTFPVKRVAGTDIPANDISYLVLACPYCNRSKKDKFPWEFPEGGKLL